MAETRPESSATATGSPQVPPGQVARFIDQKAEAGQPVVLTIQGAGEFVVRDATSIQRLWELIDRLETIETIRRGLKEIEEGKTLSLDQFKDEVRQKHGLSL